MWHWQQTKRTSPFIYIIIKKAIIDSKWVLFTNHFDQFKSICSIHNRECWGIELNRSFGCLLLWKIFNTHWNWDWKLAINGTFFSICSKWGEREKDSLQIREKKMLIQRNGEIIFHIFNINWLLIFFRLIGFLHGSTWRPLLMHIYLSP